MSKRKGKHLKAEGVLTDDSDHESLERNEQSSEVPENLGRRQWPGNFLRCRQIWFLHNAYDDTKISESVFPSLLSYMDSIKGGMRQGAVEEEQVGGTV